MDSQGRPIVLEPTVFNSGAPRALPEPSDEPVELASGETAGESMAGVHFAQAENTVGSALSGGSPAAIATAAMPAEHRDRVRLIGRIQYPQATDVYLPRVEDRVRAQVDSSKRNSEGRAQQLSKHAGIWEVVKESSQEFDQIFVWDAEGSSSVRFHADEIEKKDLGVIVHNKIILEALYVEIRNISEIFLIEEESLSDLNQDQKEINIETNSGTFISSELLIGADGSLSRVRDLSRIPIRTWSYEQLAIVTSVKTEKSLNKSQYSCI